MTTKRKSEHEKRRNWVLRQFRAGKGFGAPLTESERRLYRFMHPKPVTIHATFTQA